MMWILPVTRRELVDLITPRRWRDVPDAVEQNHPSFDIVRSDVMAAVWPTRPAEFGPFPTAIIVPDGWRLDSLAWLATYVRDFRPFTAYCRVVERAVAEQFLKGPSVPTLLGIEGVCSGLILGEALTRARGRASILNLPSTTYSATLSHAISRTLALTGGSIRPDLISRLWHQAWDLTGQTGFDAAPNVILSVWAVTMDLSGRSRTLFEPADVLSAAWHDLTTVGKIRDAVWHRLVDGYPDLEGLRSLIEMPREQRVQVIDVALRFLGSVRRGDDDRRGFLAGYLTSLLGPGTLEHADFLVPVAGLLPTSYLWYGLCAGINPKGDALPVGNPLARRIIRDLTVPDRLIDRPRCDVALEEMAMLGPSEILLGVSTKAGRVDIDILPGVTMGVRWPPHETQAEDEQRRVRDVELQHLLVEMEENSLRQRHLTERLRETLRLHGTRPQGANRRKRAGGKS